MSFLQEYTKYLGKQLENSTDSQIIFTPEEQEMFEERAAIIEFHGNTERQKSEQLAYECIVKKRK